MVRARRDTSVQVHGPALRHVRTTRGRSITSLAKCAGVSTSFLAHVERGTKRGVRMAVLMVLIEELALTDPRVLLLNPYDDVVLLWPRSGPSVVPLSSVA